MKGCFETIEQAVEYIKYLTLDNLNPSVKLYREGGCWYVEGYGQTVCNQPPIGWNCSQLRSSK